ncbi:TPR-like protein [Ramicandelaber brevisporus]|nr:TPR-like protein [Ramicandelaber brevisporus]
MQQQQQQQRGQAPVGQQYAQQQQQQPQGRGQQQAIPAQQQHPGQYGTQPPTQHGYPADFSVQQQQQYAQQQQQQQGAAQTRHPSGQHPQQSQPHGYSGQQPGAVAAQQQQQAQAQAQAHAGGRQIQQPPQQQQQAPPHHHQRAATTQQAPQHAGAVSSGSVPPNVLTGSVDHRAASTQPEAATVVRNVSVPPHAAMATTTNTRGSVPPALHPFLVQFDNLHEDILIKSGEIARKMKMEDVALDLFRRTTSIFTSSSKGYMKLGQIALERSDIVGAKQMFEHSRALDPDNGVSIYNLAQIAMEEGNLDVAFSALGEAMNHNQDMDDPRLWLCIGKLYSKYDSLEHAEQGLALAVHFDIDNNGAGFEALIALADLYKRQSRFDQSINCLLWILKHFPNSILGLDEIYRELGDVYDLHGMNQNALEAYECALQLNPNCEKAAHKCAVLLFRHNPTSVNLDRCIELIHIAAGGQYPENSAELLYYLGRIYILRHDYTKAYSAYERALQLDQSSVNLWISIGVLYYQIAQVRDACEAYSKALALNDKIPTLWHDLALVYESEGDLVQAIASYERVLSLEPSNMQAQHRIMLLKEAQQSGTTVTTEGQPAPRESLGFRDTTSSTLPSMTTLTASHLQQPQPQQQQQQPQPQQQQQQVQPPADSMNQAQYQSPVAASAAGGSGGLQAPNGTAPSFNQLMQTPQNSQNLELAAATLTSVAKRQRESSPGPNESTSTAPPANANAASRVTPDHKRLALSDPPNGDSQLQQQQHGPFPYPVPHSQSAAEPASATAAVTAAPTEQSSSATSAYPPHQTPTRNPRRSIGPAGSVNGVSASSGPAASLMSLATAAGMDLQSSSNTQQSATPKMKTGSPSTAVAQQQQQQQQQQPLRPPTPHSGSDLKTTSFPQSDQQQQQQSQPQPQQTPATTAATAAASAVTTTVATPVVLSKSGRELEEGEAEEDDEPIPVEPQPVLHSQSHRSNLSNSSNSTGNINSNSNNRSSMYGGNVYHDRRTSGDSFSQHQRHGSRGSDKFNASSSTVTTAVNKPVALSGRVMNDNYDDDDTNGAGPDSKETEEGQVDD